MTELGIDMYLPAHSMISTLSMQACRQVESDVAVRWVAKKKLPCLCNLQIYPKMMNDYDVCYCWRTEACAMFFAQMHATACGGKDARLLCLMIIYLPRIWQPIQKKDPGWWSRCLC